MLPINQGFLLFVRNMGLMQCHYCNFILFPVAVIKELCAHWQGQIKPFVSHEQILKKITTLRRSFSTSEFVFITFHLGVSVVRKVWHISWHLSESARCVS